MSVKINNQQVSWKIGQTILTVAEANGFTVQTLCHHPDLKVQANCRICVAEIKGRSNLATACSTLVEDGMQIFTDSERVRKARFLNLELIFAEHELKCAGCTFRFDCELLKLASKYQIKINRFAPRKSKRPVYKFANAVEIDGSQCIDCRSCIEVCSAIQKINYLEISGRGADKEVAPVRDKKTACIYCGQCALHCPVASAQEEYQGDLFEQALQDKKKIVVAQFAPSVRVALVEEFGMPYGENCEGKIVTALKKLGCRQVFDVNFGADLTTIVEAEELLERLHDKKAVFPLMTSCCPAWVSYVEFYHPELIPNLTISRSPHIHLAGAIKSYWAEKKGVKLENIVLVSIIPCTAKKYEASRKELFWKGRPLVDIVLTTREIAYLIKKKRLDFQKLKDSPSDKLFNSGTGAAAIYGASGGVMESALRTANSLICASSSDKNCESRLEFTEVRGLKGFKAAKVNLGGHKLKVGVVNGIGNIDKVLPKLKNYHYIEVMTCPGGCLGGGGQPIPTTNAIRQKRLEGIYKIDKNRPLRRAHENREMIKYYEFIKKNKLTNQLIYTKFHKSTGSDLRLAKPKGKKS